jgi:uncharacterized heparinase superfamily protein
MHEDAQLKPFGFASHSRYHRLNGKALQAIVDTGPPATGAWSTAACAQPLAFEVTAGADRLISNCGWSPVAVGPQALRGSVAASTISLDDASPGQPLSSWAARTLGPRLIDGAARVDVRRNETTGGVWIEASHDGWVKPYRLVHERRLFLDSAADELRGEDRLFGAESGPGAVVPYVARFHLHPEVSAAVQPDGRSVVLAGPSGKAWLLRNDAADVVLEPSVHFEAGMPQRTEQVVLRGTVKGDAGARVRWKLSSAERSGKGAA